jgi:hypothetical protein
MLQAFPAFLKAQIIVPIENIAVALFLNKDSFSLQIATFFMSLSFTILSTGVRLKQVIGASLTEETIEGFKAFRTRLDTKERTTSFKSLRTSLVRHKLTRTLAVLVLQNTIALDIFRIRLQITLLYQIILKNGIEVMQLRKEFAEVFEGREPFFDLFEHMLDLFVGKSLNMLLD